MDAKKIHKLGLAISKELGTTNPLTIKAELTTDQAKSLMIAFLKWGFEVPIEPDWAEGKEHTWQLPRFGYINVRIKNQQ